MLIIVGSKSAVKTRAVELAAAQVWPDKRVTVLTCDVPSGVAEQPMHVVNGKLGALTRARNAMYSVDGSTVEHYDNALVVGIESYIGPSLSRRIDARWKAYMDSSGKKYVDDDDVVIYDAASIAVYSREKKDCIFVESEKTYIPDGPAIVNQLEAKHHTHYFGYNKTVGEVLAERERERESGRKLDAKDWHSSFREDGLSRLELLKAALIDAFMQTRDGA